MCQGSVNPKGYWEALGKLDPCHFGSSVSALGEVGRLLASSMELTLEVPGTGWHGSGREERSWGFPSVTKLQQAGIHLCLEDGPQAPCCCGDLQVWSSWCQEVRKAESKQDTEPSRRLFFGGRGDFPFFEGKDFLVRNKDNGGLATVPILWDSASDSPEGRKLLRDQEQQQSMSSEGLVAAPCLSPWPLMTMTS